MNKFNRKAVFVCQESPFYFEILRISLNMNKFNLHLIFVLVRLIFDLVSLSFKLLLQVEQGHLSLLKAGVACSDKLYFAGIEHFCSLLSINTLREFNIERIQSSTENDQENENPFESGESDDEDFPLEIELDVSSMEEISIDITSNFALSDCRCVTREKMSCVILPAAFSQEGLNEDRGSSACTVISLITGYIFSRQRFY